MSENRGTPRISTDVLVDVAGDNVLLFQRIHDISLGGLSIETPSLQAPGTEVDLNLSFPELHEEIETKGVVVRVATSPRPTMAIRFAGLTGEQSEILKRYLYLVEERENQAQRLADEGDPDDH
jgi:uncharacterized protein (TIGR02266 family)